MRCVPWVDVWRFRFHVPISICHRNAYELAELDFVKEKAKLAGLQHQVRAWLVACPLPHHQSNPACASAANHARHSKRLALMILEYFDPPQVEALQRMMREHSARGASGVGAPWLDEAERERLSVRVQALERDRSR